MGEAMWLQIRTIQVAIASVLASTAIVAFSGVSDAADTQPAITPAVKCEALVGLSFASSTIVIEKAEAVPEAPAGRCGRPIRKPCASQSRRIAGHKASSTGASEWTARTMRLGSRSLFPITGTEDSCFKAAAA